MSTSAPAPVPYTQAEMELVEKFVLNHHRIPYYSPYGVEQRGYRRSKERRIYKEIRIRKMRRFFAGYGPQEREERPFCTDCNQRTPLSFCWSLSYVYFVPYTDKRKRDVIPRPIKGQPHHTDEQIKGILEKSQSEAGEYILNSRSQTRPLTIEEWKQE